MIKLKNVKKNYNDVSALSDFSFEFKPRKFYGIIGKSGSGKSTLVNIIGGLTNFTSGEIEYDEIITNVYSDISYIFQESYLIENLTIEENINIILRLNNLRNEKKMDDILNKLHILKYKYKRINQLSVGEKQRVNIAIALLKNSKVLIADEPTASIDDENAINIFQILKELSKEILVIIISHNVSFINTYCDEVLHLSNGKLIESDIKKDELVLQHRNIKNNTHNLSFLNSIFVYRKVMKNQISRQIFTSIFVMLFIGVLSFLLNLVYTNKSEMLEKAILTSKFQAFLIEDEDNSIKNKNIDLVNFDILYNSCLELNLNITDFNGYVENSSLYYELIGRRLLEYAIIDEKLGENEVVLTDYILYCLRNYKIIEFDNLQDCIGKEIIYLDYKFKVMAIDDTGFEENRVSFSANNFFSNKKTLYRNAVMSKKTYYNFFSATYEKPSFKDTNAFHKGELVYFSRNDTLKKDEINITLSTLNQFLNKNMTLEEANNYQNEIIEIELRGNEKENFGVHEFKINSILKEGYNNQISFDKCMEIFLFTNGIIDFTPINYYVYQWKEHSDLLSTIQYIHAQDLNIAHQSSNDIYLVYNNIKVAIQIFSFIMIVLICFIIYQMLYMIYNFFKINQRNFAILQIHGASKLSCIFFIVYDNLKVLLLSSLFSVFINLILIKGMNSFIKNNLLVNIETLFFSLKYFLCAISIIGGIFILLSLLPILNFRKKEITTLFSH